MFAIQVKLRGANGDWSKPYTYKHALPLNAGVKVVVPVRDHFSIGEVVGTDHNPVWKEGIKYKWIVQAVDFTQYKLMMEKDK